MAVAFAQPTDMVKVQFQAHVRGAEGEGVKRYSGIMDAYRTIARTESIRGLWKGCGPNITRNDIVNCSELVTYDIIKELILKYNIMTGRQAFVLHLHVYILIVTITSKCILSNIICKFYIFFIFTDNLPCHFTAAFSSGFITTIVASPVDVVKNRFMNCSAGKYNGTINCAVTMMRNEGPKAFYKGCVVIKSQIAFKSSLAESRQFQDMNSELSKSFCLVK
uniref:Uncharacterized protein n=1 Tax=Oncorhynchus mykiss TaxID=8022 RepID=A0A8L0DQW0_ONCMY